MLVNIKKSCSLGTAALTLALLSVSHTAVAAPHDAHEGGAAGGAHGAAAAASVPENLRVALAKKVRDYRALQELLTDSAFKQDPEKQAQAVQRIQAFLDDPEDLLHFGESYPSDALRFLDRGGQPVAAERIADLSEEQVAYAFFVGMRSWAAETDWRASAGVSEADNGVLVERYFSDPLKILAAHRRSVALLGELLTRPWPQHDAGQTREKTFGALCYFMQRDILPR